MLRPEKFVFSRKENGLANEKRPLRISKFINEVQ
jgi:hypothetical protein